MNQLSLVLSNRIQGKLKTKRECSYIAINKSFNIISLKINGLDREFKEKNSTSNYKTITFDKNINGILEIEYEGVLDGTTGQYPYVIECTMNDFYILRDETCYYPKFYIPGTEEALESYINPTEKDYWQVKISVLEKRSFATNLVLENDYYFGYNPTIVVGKYKEHKSYFGSIFYENLEEDTIKRIENIVLETNLYLNKYKKAKINSYKFIIIPSGYGSFVLPNTLILTKDCCNNYSQMIHELTHTNWNPISSIDVQKARFFDEAISQYLTYRVLDALNLQSKEQTEQEYIELYKKMINDWNYEPHAIIEYAELGLGDLSYSFGALALVELDKMLGRNQMDKIIKNMFIKYQTEPIDFEKFKKMFPNETDTIFRDYFYTCNASRKYI